MCLGFILLKPVVGWVAGIDLALLGKQDSKIYDGTNGSKYTDGLIVAHVSLPHGRLASIETVNIFERDPLSVIRFPKTSSEAVECTINRQCILNYLYGGLEGKRAGSLQGPVTFGEIAYLLHNQTMVTLTIH